MNTIDTTQIVDPNVQQPFGGPSLAFLESSTVEAFKNVVLGLIGNSYSATTVYVLYGCVRSGAADGASSGTVTITAGAVFFGGEVFTVQAFSGTMATGKAVYSALSSTSVTPDPVTFSDGSSHTVHFQRQWLPSIATSGTYAQSGWVNISNALTHTFAIGDLGNMNLGSDPAPFITVGNCGTVRIVGNLTSTGGVSPTITWPSSFSPKTNRSFITNIQYTNTVVTCYINASNNTMYFTKGASASWTSGDDIYLCFTWNVND